MLKRSNIERILKANGVAVTAPDDEIKSILIGARWHKDDVETALLVLRENSVSHKVHIDSFHDDFWTDDKLRPEAISSLLGVDVEVLSKSINLNEKYSRGHTVSFGQIIQIGFLALCFCVIFIFISMWYFEMGIFHIATQ